MLKAIVSITVLASIAAWSPMPGRGAIQMATGFVYEDRNRNGVRDAGEPGIPNIRVSDQIDIVTTDANGRWSLPVASDVTYFVIKPRGYMTRIGKDNLPAFYYTHKPEGSPVSRFPGVSPTGALPASIDFPLTKKKEPNKFSAIFFGDTQSRDIREIEYLTQGLITQMSAEGASFGITLGDILFDNLSIFKEHNEAISMLGIPWYNVLGNHDVNYDSADDEHSDETFESFYGPNYYSFDYGLVHMVVLDDVNWIKTENKYTAKLGAKQMSWLKRDLALVPQDRLVILNMHIPLTEVEEKSEILGLLSQRPYSLSCSAHTHFMEHRFFTDKDGFKRAKPHHHVVNVTTCGSWWSGKPDALGIPHSTMRDGAPRGYSVFSFDGNNYSIEFRAAGKPREYQMNIMAPQVVPVEDITSTDIYVNVFGGSQYSSVEFRLGTDATWIPMQKTLEKDPSYVAVTKQDADVEKPYRKLSDPIDSPHLWKAKLPPTLLRGYQPIQVRTKDMFGQVYLGMRGIRLGGKVDPATAK